MPHMPQCTVVAAPVATATTASKAIAEAEKRQHQRRIWMTPTAVIKRNKDTAPRLSEQARTMEDRDCLTSECIDYIKRICRSVARNKS